MRNLHALFSMIFVLREGKSLNSCVEVNVFLRRLSSYISNTHFVSKIAPLQRADIGPLMFYPLREVVGSTFGSRLHGAA